MSGSAKKRREKERGQQRRERAVNRRAAELARTSAEFHQEFMRMVDMPSDRVPGFTHDIAFAPNSVMAPTRLSVTINGAPYPGPLKGTS